MKDNDPTGINRLLDDKRFTDAEVDMGRAIEHFGVVARDSSFTLLQRKAIEQCIQDVQFAYKSMQLNRYNLINHVRTIEGMSKP